VVVERLTMVSGHSNAEMRLLKRMLSRNSAILKKRIEGYEKKLRELEEESPEAENCRTEKQRAEDLMLTVLRMQQPLAYMG
jgi:hypothetical protein